VHWQVAGAPAADFQGGTLPSGTLTFSAGQRFQDVSFAVLPDAAAPRSETLKLTLSQPASGDSLGVHSAAVHLVNVHVTSGDDHIVATDDSDVVTTLDGNDFVYGEGGDDSLDGGKGSDALHGGTGNDYLTGGAGKDSFVFDTTPDAVHNLDHISDFTVGEDNIKLDHAIFTALGGPGALTAGYFYAGPAAHDGDDRIIYDPGSGDLFYDTNGSAAGGSTEFAVLAKNLALTAGDFLVI